MSRIEEIRARQADLLVCVEEDCARHSVERNARADIEWLLALAEDLEDEVMELFGRSVALRVQCDELQEELEDRPRS